MLRVFVIIRRAFHPVETEAYVSKHSAGVVQDGQGPHVLRMSTSVVKEHTNVSIPAAIPRAATCVTVNMAFVSTKTVDDAREIQPYA